MRVDAISHGLISLRRLVFLQSMLVRFSAGLGFCWFAYPADAVRIAAVVNR